MSLVDDLDARRSSVQAGMVDTILAEADTETREAIHRALTDRADKGYRWSAPDLARRLEAEGFQVTFHAIKEWRAKNVAR